MRAIHRTTVKGAEVHSGGYSPDTLAEKADRRIDHAYQDRLEELRLKAKFALSRTGEVSLSRVLDATITQVGKTGFYWKTPDMPIPEFEPWGEATRLENERIFNART